MSSEFFRLTTIKSTRKPHRCVCCGTTFPAGSEMLSYAGMYEGDFCHFYYCPVCDDLYHILGWDWSEGIQQAEEALADEGVIASIKCPFFEQAIAERKEQEAEYYRRHAGERDLPEYDHPECENEPAEDCYDYDVDFLTGNIKFVCDCFTGERRTWVTDIRKVAQAFKESEENRHAV